MMVAFVDGRKIQHSQISDKMWVQLLSIFAFSVYCFGAEYESINTPNSYKYVPVKYDFSRHRYVRFEVKACNDAYINLMADVQQDRWLTYEIVIGAMNNTRAFIRKVKLELPARTQISGHNLNCNTFRTFFILWDSNNTIEVWTLKGPIMSYHDADPYKITGVSVATAGWGATGIWKVYNPDLKPRVCCKPHPEIGNEYCVIPGLNCRFFTQQDIAMKISARLTYLNRCKYGDTKFDVGICNCAHAAAVACNV